jgi:DNA-binding NarL/FixJ family response regulator
MSSGMKPATRTSRRSAAASGRGNAAASRPAGADGPGGRPARPAPRAAGSDKPLPAIRVLCVDDHPVIHEGLRAQFEIDGGIEIVGQLALAERLVSEVARVRPHVVLLDIEMPGPDAFETAERLRDLHPEVRIIVLSAHIRDGYISAAFKSGASGYFSKADALEEIMFGIRDVAGGNQGAFVLGAKVRERCRPLHARHAAGGGRRDTPTAQESSAGPPATPSRRGRPRCCV